MEHSQVVAGGSGLSRRTLLRMTGGVIGGIAVGRVLVACGGDDDAAVTTPPQTTDAPATTAPSADIGTLDLQLNWLMTADFAPIYMALDQGLFEARGASVALLTGGPGLQASEAIVAGGTADLGLSTVMSGVVSAIAQGTALKVIGAIHPQSPLHFMAAPGERLESVEDFVGKRVGGPQGRQVQIDAIFRVNGLEPDYTYVPTGFDHSPLVAGDVDIMSAYVTGEALSYEFEVGEAPALISYADLGLPDYTTVIIAREDDLETRRDELSAFLAGLRDGIEAAETDPETGASLAVEEYGADLGLDPEVEAEKSRRFVPLFRHAEPHADLPLLWVDAERVAGPIYEGYEAADLPTVDVEDLLDMSLLEELG